MNGSEFHFSLLDLHEEFVAHFEIANAIHAHLRGKAVIRMNHFQMPDLLAQSHLNTLFAKNVHLRYKSIST
jgi:hypothetical protein